MIHPLIHLAVSHPELLAEHGEAYVALVGKEVSKWRASVVRRIVMAVVAAVAALLTLIFAGVAVMLWGIAPDGEVNSPWLLIAPPALMLIVTLVAGFVAAKGGLASPLFTDVKAQVRADLAMLREVNAE